MPSDHPINSEVIPAVSQDNPPRRRVFLNTLFSILAKTQSAIFSYITLRILLSAMSVTEYGYYTVLFQAAMANLSLLFQFGIPNLMVRFVSEYYTQARYRLIHRLFRTLNWLQILLWSVLLALFLVLAPWFTQLANFPGHVGELRVFAVAAVAFLIQDNYRSVLSSLFRHQTVFWVQMAYNVLRLAAILLVVQIGYTFSGVLIAEAAVFVAGLVFFVIAYRRTIKPLLAQDNNADEPIRWKRYVRYGTLMYVNEIGNLVLSGIDLFFVTGLLGAFAVGMYGLANRILGLITSVMPQTVLRSLIEPIFFSEYGADRGKSIEVGYSMLSKLIAFITIPTAIWLSLMAKPIIVHFFDPKFADASLILIILAFFLVTSNQKLPMGLVLQTAERIDLSLIVKTLGIVKVVAAVLILPTGGVTAMAWIALAASSAEIAFMYILMSRVLNVRGDLAGFARMGFNGLATAAVVVFVRGYLDSFFGVIASVALIGFVFLALCYVTKPFSPRERDWLNRHLKYPIWVF